MKLEEELYRQFRELVTQSSPECLHSGGEASQQEVHAKIVLIETRWSELEILAGRSVQADEIINRMFEEPHA